MILKNKGKKKGNMDNFNQIQLEHQKERFVLWHYSTVYDQITEHSSHEETKE